MDRKTQRMPAAHDVSERFTRRCKMKRIGLIGGLSAESTTHFYSALTRLYVDRYDNTDYPEIVLFSVRFATLIGWASSGAWDRFAGGIVKGLRSLEAAGAEFGVITANLPHVVFDELQRQTSLPLLHIAEVVSEAAHERGFRRVALLGTLATMEADFYPQKLTNHGVHCMIPEKDEQHTMQDIIDNELTRGVVSEASTHRFLAIIESLKHRGADAVILGCTEIPMLVSDANSPLPVLDSTQLLVEKTLATAME